MSTKKIVKKAPKKAPAPAAEAAVAVVSDTPTHNIGVGDTVTFNGYVEEVSNPLFSPGESLVVKGTDTDDSGRSVIVCVSEEMSEAYDNDPDSVDAEQLLAEEVTLSKVAPQIIQPRRRNIADVTPSFRSIGDMEAILENKDLVEAAHQLYGESQRNLFFFGGVLAKIFYDRVYESHGYSGDTAFADFCANEFGMKVRKARYLIQIYSVFSRLEGFDISKLDSIGWSKASLLSRFATQDNANDLVELARDKTFKALETTLKEEYTEDGKTASGMAASRDGVVKAISFNFRLYEERGMYVRELLEQAARQTGKRDGDLFEHIISEWATQNLT